MPTPKTTYQMERARTPWWKDRTKIKASIEGFASDINPAHMTKIT